MRARPLFPFVLAAGLALPLSASGPTFWTVATSADFLGGRSDGVFVNLEGVVTPGPTLTSRLTSAPPQVWALAQAGDGTLWAGTGADGRVLRLREGQAEQVAFDTDEANVFALAVSGSRVFAASGPDGRVYVIEADGTARPFFDPAEKYIWALLVDGQDRLWVGAGNPAVIYRVDAAGAGTPIYKPPAAHVVALALDAEGRVLAGTESPGRLYRIGADDRPFALLDSGLTELRAVAAGADGTVYAAAVNRGEASPSNNETTSVAVTLAAAEPGSGSGDTDAATRRSQIFRIAADGTWEAIWQTPDIVYDLAVTPAGELLVASGPAGRLYQVTATRNVRLLTGVDAGQITRFAGRAGGATAFATANPGRVVALGTAAQSPAAYLSPIRDTKTIATWGLVRWESAGDVALFTRSGNTEKPDDSWSDWVGPYTAGAGSAVTSPPARFIQWRAVLTSRNGQPPPRLTAVTLAYLPRNTRPNVSSITVHPPGVVFQRPFSSEDGAIAGLDDLTAAARRPPGDTAPAPPSPGRRMFQKGLQTIVWKAEDPDTDRLIYTLQYRRDGDPAWRDLRRDLMDTIFVWDTTAMADGRYVVRVAASDSLSNAADRTLVGTLESEPIVIDNTPPSITTTTATASGTPRLTIEVRDQQSPIQKVEYSVAGREWQLVYPADGLADSPIERYEIALPAGTPLTEVVIRATDLLQNVTSQPASVR
jgi:hypothetical protein